MRHSNLPVLVAVLLTVLLFTSCGNDQKNRVENNSDSTVVQQPIAVSDTTPLGLGVAAQGDFDQIPLVDNFAPGKKPGTDIDRKSRMFEQIKFRGKGSEERRLGIKLASQGDLTGAIEQFTKSIEIHQRNPDAYFYRGKAKWEMKDYKGADEDFTQSVRIRPMQPAYYYYRGQMYLEMQRYSDALSDFNTTLKWAPNYTDAINYKGVVLAKLNKHDEAIAAYDEAIAKMPGHALAYYNKGTSLAALKKFNEADDMFTRSLNIDPDYSQAYVNRGNTRFMLERFADAAADYTIAISKQPGNAETYYNRAFAFQRTGKKEEACDDWRKAAGMGHKNSQNMLDRFCK